MKSNKQGAVSAVDWKQEGPVESVMGESLPKRSARHLRSQYCMYVCVCVCRLSVHELCVSLRSRDDHIHPDPHGLC